MSRKSKIYACLVTLLVALAGCTATAPDRGAQPTPSTQARRQQPTYAYREVRLENGLRVITLEDFSCPIVAVQLWYHVGSKDDHPDRQGFAHLFEHMMFRGTDRLGPTDHFELIRRVGGTSNAYTTFDVTVYHQTLPANQLRLALWLEAERMAFLRVDEKSFATERKVVEEERRLGLNGPYGTLAEKLQAELFKVHPYRWPVIGNIAHLRVARAEELRAFWKRHYVPNNATLVIAGAVKHARAEALAREFFGWIPGGADPPQVSVREPQPTAKRSVVVKQKNAPAPVVGIAYRTVPVGHADAPALALIRSILSGGNSCRLYRDLVAERQLAVRVLALDLTGELDGVFAVAAALHPIGGKMDKALERIEAHMQRLRAEPVSPRELLKARNKHQKGLVVRTLSVASKARLLGQAAVVEGDVSKVNRQLQRIRAVTAADIQRVARTLLADERAVAFRVPGNLLGKLLGRAGEAGKIPATTSPAGRAVGKGPRPIRPEGFAKEPPLAGLLKATPRFAHTRHVLKNGLTVIVVPNHEVPFVTVRLGLLGGAWGEAKHGAASLAMRMLTRGTARHSERELAEELDAYAISLWGSAGMDSATAGASCLTEHVERAVKLLAEAALTPTFPAEEFQKLRKRVRAELAVYAAEPFYVADREFRKRLYGDHPYSRSALGETADVDALKLADLKVWWRRFVRPDMAVLIFAGDIDADAALALARDAFGKWQAKGSAPRADLPEPPAPASTRIYLVDRPGSTQCQIRVGQRGITRHHRDYFTGQVVSGYFGGAFGSRLNKAIRVKKGLTYGAGGGWRARRFAGMFAVGTFSQSRSAAQAVRAVLAEIRRLAAEAPTSEELDRTRSFHLGSFARWRETPQQAAGELWLIASHGLAPDYFQTMLRKIARTTSPECLQMVRRTLDPDKMTVVVVGEAARLRKELEKIAPVQVVEAAGGR